MAETTTDTITLTVNRKDAEALARAWEGDDGRGTDYTPIVRALRDMLTGQDGFLHDLNEALGREH